MQKRKGETNKNRHIVLYGVTIISAALGIGFVVASIIVFRNAPDEINGQHFWNALKDIGPAIAGSWVLCAALLAITAAGITAIATFNDSAEHARQRYSSIVRVCVGEIKAFWDQCNRLELDAKLQSHIDWLVREKADKDKLGSGARVPDESDGKEPIKLGPFRRAFGDDWFVFFRVDPEALGVLLPEASSLYISLSARCRHLASRLNYLNGCRWDTNDLDFWIAYHKDTREVLRALHQPSSKMLRMLGSEVNPKTFVFDQTEPAAA